MGCFMVVFRQLSTVQFAGWLCVEDLLVFFVSFNKPEVNELLKVERSGSFRAF